MTGAVAEGSGLALAIASQQRRTGPAEPVPSPACQSSVFGQEFPDSGNVSDLALGDAALTVRELARKQGTDFGAIISTLPSDIINNALIELAERGVWIKTRRVPMGYETKWGPLLAYLGLCGVGTPEPPTEIVVGRCQSRKSRLNCAWAFGNATTRWRAMITLTVGDGAPWPRSNAVISEFIRAMRVRYGQFDYGWFLEFQKRRRAPHWHVFVGDGGGLWPAMQAAPIVPRWKPPRRGKPGKWRRTITGEVEEFIVATWQRILGDRSAKFLDFQLGGIIEHLESEKGAAKYAAAEAGKVAQKVAWDEFELSMWWRLANHLQYPADAGEEMIVVGVKRDGINGRIWDGSLIAADAETMAAAYSVTV